MEARQYTQVTLTALWVSACVGTEDEVGARVVPTDAAQAELSGLQFEPARWTETFRPITSDMDGAPAILLNAPSCADAGDGASVGAVFGDAIRDGEWSTLCETVFQGADDDVEFIAGSANLGRIAVVSAAVVDVFESSAAAPLLTVLFPAGLTAGRPRVALEDLDGDGYPELLIATYFQPGEAPEGPTLLVFGGGQTGRLTWDQAIGFIRGFWWEYPNMDFVVEPIRDVDGDGLENFLVGYESLDAPAWIFNGLPPTDATVDDATATLAYGISMASGDFSGDGIADLVVENGRQNGVHLFRGPLEGVLDEADADWTVVTTVADDRFGFSAANAGDQDGDDVDDLLVGASGEFFDALGIGDPEYAGAAYLFLGPLVGDADLAAAGVAFTGSNAQDRFGEDVQAGDLDGDGVPELLITSYARESIYVFEGGS